MGKTLLVIELYPWNGIDHLGWLYHPTFPSAWTRKCSYFSISLMTLNFETGSHRSWAGFELILYLEMTLIFWPFCLQLSNAKITGMCAPCRLCCCWALIKAVFVHVLNQLSYTPSHQLQLSSFVFWMQKSQILLQRQKGVYSGASGGPGTQM